MIHNAQVIAIKGNFDEALALVKEITSNYPIALVNSLNPFRIEGQKTAAFEVCEFLGDAPDFHAIPVGNAGNITSYWKGYKEYKEKNKTTRLPKMLGFQAAKAAPIVEGKIIKNPETIATAIRIGNPASWKSAEAARNESGGLIHAVTDEEILEAFAKTERTETKRLQALEKAYRAANFYLRKNTTLQGGTPMLAEDMRTLSLDCQAWLQQALATPFEGRTVVVTHFAPTLRSGDPRYGATPGTAGFCNSLDHLLPFAQVWMHGHLHCTNDYTVSGTSEGQPYACRLVANPRGYYSKGEQAAFQSHFVIDLP